ncbi:hypothetical protein Tco_1131728 [Tanacetum coccineum]|uniref:Uncharacterized protein n=1 Tax=Tanacetum coccineum TaxID=301880 RepID=A0ABQ5JCR1_9ASTR
MLGQLVPLLDKREERKRQSSSAKRGKCVTTKAKNSQDMPPTHQPSTTMYLSLDDQAHRNKDFVLGARGQSCHSLTICHERTRSPEETFKTGHLLSFVERDPVDMMSDPVRVWMRLQLLRLSKNDNG